MEKYLQEAFKAFDELNEDVFDISTVDGLEKAKEFENEEPLWDDRDEEIIIDPLAETEEELEKDYIGKAILQCEICQSMIYKDPADVVIDEEAELANVDEICPFCQSQDGFKVIGEIKPFCGDEECEEKHEEDTEHKESTEDEEAKDEEEVKEETLKESYTRDDLFDLISEEDMDRIDELLTGDGDGDVFSTMGEADDVADAINNLNIAGLTAHAEYLDEDDELYGDYDAVVVFEYEGLDEAIKTRKKVRTEELAKKAVEESKKARHKVGGSNYEKVRRVLDNLTEADKPAAISIEDAQKWVDFDMKRYGKISERTNRLVKKAGFQIIKDDHGDYEVAAGKFESCEKNLKENFELLVQYLDEDKASFVDYFDSIKEAEEYARNDSDIIHYQVYDKDGKIVSEDNYDESLNEDFEKVDIETDKEKMSMTAGENGKVTVTTEPKVEETKEVISPVSDEVKAEFKSSEEENTETPEEIDYDFDEFEEKDFDSLGEGFLKRVYENVRSFKTTSGKVNGNEIMLEGLITFKSGKQAKTNFVFEAYKATKTGKLKFIGENKQFAKGKKSFTLSGKADGKKLVCEALTYNYVAKSADGNSKRLYGTIKK